jgi:hypothetical protein
LDSRPCCVIIYEALRAVRAIDKIEAKGVISSNKLVLSDDISLPTFFRKLPAKVLLHCALTAISTNVNDGHEVKVST